MLKTALLISGLIFCLPLAGMQQSKAAEQARQAALEEADELFIRALRLENANSLMEAITLYQKSAGLGDLRAAKNLGLIYKKLAKAQNDPVLQKIYAQEAYMLLSKAAQDGSPRHYDLFLTGGKLVANTKQSTPEDTAFAQQIFNHLFAAAQQGNAEAQTSLGVYLKRKSEEEQNSQLKKQFLKNAKYWFNKAVEQNHPYAQNHLAVMYIQKRHVTQDPTKKERLFNKAICLFEKATQKCICPENKCACMAAANLALCYEERSESISDPQEKETVLDQAIKCALQARKQGHSKAEKILNRLMLLKKSFIKECVHCKKPATKHCGRCKKASYCSQDCQLADWKMHQTGCNQIGKEKS